MQAETLGDTLRDSQVLVETLADSLAEVEAKTLSDTLSDAKALVDTLDDSLAEVDAETLGDTLSDAQAMVDTLADLRKHSSTRWLTRKQRWRQRRYVTS